MPENIKKQIQFLQKYESKLMKIGIFLISISTFIAVTLGEYEYRLFPNQAGKIPPVEYLGNIKMLPIYFIIFTIIMSIRKEKISKHLIISSIYISIIIFLKFINYRSIYGNVYKISLPNGNESIYPSGHIAVSLVLAYLFSEIFHKTKIKNILYAYPFVISICLFKNKEHFISDMLATLGIFFIVYSKKITGRFSTGNV